MQQMLGHQFHREGFIARGQRFHDFGVLVVRVFCRAGSLVHQRNQGAARNQLAQQLRQHFVAHQLGHADVKVAKQFGAAAHVAAVHRGFFAGDMLF
jgi:hypothetical protein